MRRSNLRSWMWSEAVEMLAEAERLHRQFFRPQETEQSVIVFTALPGVDSETVSVAIEDGVLAISGQRLLPPELSRAAIHRLELPQGSFRRRVPIPPGRYDEVRRSSWNGCLVVTLRKQTR
jgi:HSP20 family protein